MTTTASWDQIWQEIRDALRKMPRCTIHPKYPCVYTLRQEIPNTIQKITEDFIKVKSHSKSSKGPRKIEATVFRRWWKVLNDKGRTSIDPGQSPHRQNSVFVGAIFVECLGERVLWDPNSGKRGEIILIDASATLDSSTPEHPEYSDEFGTLTEGPKGPRTIYAYDRNPQARKACIAHYKPICDVCKFDFGEVWGEIGVGYIHVHHLDPISNAEAERVVDPIEDLRPLCPNCHAMAHRKDPPYSISQLKKLRHKQQASRG